MFIRKILYKIQRFVNSIFTYNCANCNEFVRGTCLCEKCKNELLSAKNNEKSPFAYYYVGPARAVMLQFKFSNDPYYCLDTLFDWLCESYNKLGDTDFDAVVTVPSFKNKETPIAEIADKFSYMHNLKFCPNLLKKIKATEKQHKLSSTERRTNLVGAFMASPDVKGKKILLIDDIFTTGSTINECKKAIVSSGAEKVSFITILKTEYPEN